MQTQQYLNQLRDSKYIAATLEVPQIRHLPSRAIDFHVLRPMRWATRGTIIAAQEAQKHGFAVNLSGGYHHAKPGGGEGFSIYSDAGIAVAALRQRELISDTDRIVCVDTDAHQGNGVCHTFMSDQRVFIFDIFNGHIYPILDVDARKRVDCAIPITSDCTDSEYMHELKTRLPGFLDSVCKSPVGLAIYNAATDILLATHLEALTFRQPQFARAICLSLESCANETFPLSWFQVKDTRSKAIIWSLNL